MRDVGAKVVSAAKSIRIWNQLVVLVLVVEVEAEALIMAKRYALHFALWSDLIHRLTYHKS